MSNQSEKAKGAPETFEDANIQNDVPHISKFEVRGHEMIERLVKRSGNSGRIYLPPNWINKKVKVIRID
ncbi:MAG: DUF2080 family transposase-associated protein [Candidatus Hodarchaeales archaeon]|jgi:putative transposon-encoded protein